MMSRVIFHIDVNSAYLSWSAAYKLQQGAELDLRTVPSVVGGDEKSRHGIVLAKSMPTKVYGIQTGMPLRDAYQLCPELIVVPPNYHLYLKASAALLEIIECYSPTIQRFSIDECFVDFTHMVRTLGDPITVANEIRTRIEQELGFTVNIGISCNKILAKMASDFTKPNRVHTLFPEEVAEKMWPLPVRELFMVGRQTEKKLHKIGIMTIGQLANAPLPVLQSHFKSFGLLIHSYANGIDPSPVRKSNHEVVKGMGNSTTAPFNLETYQDANQVLLSLAESVGMRLRIAKVCCGLITISTTTTEFEYRTHQRKLDVATDSTSYIYEISKQLLAEIWKMQPLRKLGIRASDLQDNDYIQTCLFENFPFEKQKLVDQSIDAIRERYGNKAIMRASFLHSGIKPINGGVSDEDYPVMTSIL